MQSLLGIAVLLWRMRAEAWEQTAWSEDSLGPHPWSAFGRGGIASQETEELAGTTVLPCSLAQWQRHLLRAANLDTDFLPCFTLNSKPLLIHATALLG